MTLWLLVAVAAFSLFSALTDVSAAVRTHSSGGNSGSGSSSSGAGSGSGGDGQVGDGTPFNADLPAMTPQQLWEYREDARDMFYHGYDAYMKYGCVPSITGCRGGVPFVLLARCDDGHEPAVRTRQ